MTHRFDLILHPVRMRIIAEISEKPATSRELAQALPDVAQASLYRHIKRLLDGGVLRIAEEKPVNGAMERTFALVAGQNRISNDEGAELSSQDHIQYFSIFAANLIDTFGRYARHADTDKFSDEGLSYNQSVLYLSEEERAKLKTDVAAILLPLIKNKPRGDRKRFTLASVVVPSEGAPK